MRKDLYELLISIDEKGQWEVPRSFRWRKLIKKVVSFKNDFEKIFGFKLDLDKQVQDASFIADLRLLEERKDSARTVFLSYTFCFRFSNFGNLFTVMNMPKEKEKYYSEIMACRQILDENGYIYIDQDELEEIYDGVNEPYEEGLTWWTRFFDYL